MVEFGLVVVGLGLHYMMEVVGFGLVYMRVGLWIAVGLERMIGVVGYWLVEEVLWANSRQVRQRSRRNT